MVKFIRRREHKRVGSMVVIFIGYKNKMKSTKNPKDQAFQNLIIQIKLYLKSNDIDSLQYLLDGEDQNKLLQIRQNLSTKEKTLFDQVIGNLNQQKQQSQPFNQIKPQPKVKAALFEQKEDSESEVLQNFQKQYKVTDIVYGQNYSYPFIGLLQKMSSIYFYKSHPNPFPQPSLKMLHSLIETLFSYVFDPNIRQNFQNKKHHHKKSFSNYLKQYLFFVFEKQYQKFASFHKLFKSIKTSISQKQISEEDLNLQRSKSLQNSPLTSTQNLEQLEYFQKISGEIKNEAEFKEFSKIKCLNFLYFGEKRLRQLIDPQSKFLVQHIQKQILQLISFVLCRFIRKVILGCIKNKCDGKLSDFSQNQNIESVDVKRYGNSIIDQYWRKVQDFLKLDQPLEEIAKRTFLRQFYEYDYEKFIPKAVLKQSVKKLEKQKKSDFNLPQEIWVSSKYYQSLWIQRVAAEEFIRENFEHQVLKREKGKRNDYANFIKQNFKQFEENGALLWIKYLTLIHKEEINQNLEKAQIEHQRSSDIQETGPKNRKKVKLQSLSN